MVLVGWWVSWWTLRTIESGGMRVDETEKRDGDGERCSRVGVQDWKRR